MKNVLSYQDVLDWWLDKIEFPEEPSKEEPDSLIDYAEPKRNHKPRKVRIAQIMKVKAVLDQLPANEQDQRTKEILGRFERLQGKAFKVPGWKSLGKRRRRIAEVGHISFDVVQPDVEYARLRDMFPTLVSKEMPDER